MIDKIGYRHEAEVLGMAYALIERHGTIPDAAALATWLAARQSFVRDFIAKELCPKVGDGLIRRLCFRA